MRKSYRINGPANFALNNILYISELFIHKRILTILDLDLDLGLDLDLDLGLDLDLD